MVETSKMKPVFLSASFPDPERDPRFYDSADLTAIREAVIGLASAVLPHTTLVFGGHPAISPLVRFVAERFDLAENVVIYQSRLYEDVIPKDSQYFENLEWTNAVDDDKDQSLEEMRKAMIESKPFGAAVFIGGMDGVLEEFKMFKQHHNGSAHILPVASTGAAALELWEKSTLPPEQKEALKNNFSYYSLFTRLLAD